jgi:hypothetical protein
MNRIFKSEVQSRFKRIVCGAEVARDAPHEAQAVPASGPAHAVHPAHPPAYHVSSREHMDREAHSSHDQHAGHSAEMFCRRFWWTLLLSIPTFVWSPMVQH